MPTLVDSPSVVPQNIGRRAVTSKHPLYDLLFQEWTDLANVREGTGGFLDGTALVAHPREWMDHDADAPVTPTKKLKARRKLAHYENIAAAIIEAKKSTLFREPAARRVGAAGDQGASEIEAWWQDVDGRGTPIDEAMQAWWDLAATFGHVVLLFEAPTPDPAILTAADQRQPRIRVFTPLDVLNWLVDDAGEITALKIAEAVPLETFADLRSHEDVNIRVVNSEGWALFDNRGDGIASGEHGLDRMPATFLYGRRRSVATEVGQSVLGNAGQYTDLYNLVSELRELLRNQTFSMVNIPLGTGDGAMAVEDAKTMMGKQAGTMNVLFSGLAAQILTADSSNVTAYQDEIRQRKRDIFRVTGVQWESDSKDAEAEGSLKVKREEMNTRLAAYADECQKADLDLAELWYRWRHGPDRGPKQMDADEVVISYPSHFDPTPFEDILSQIQAAKEIGMPSMFLKELRKSILTKFEGMENLSPKLLAEIAGQIEQAEDDPTPAEEARQRLEVQRLALEGRMHADREQPPAESSPEARPDR